MSDNTEKREVNMNRKEIKEIRLTECRAFEGNPFAVRDDAEMEMLKDSIRESGVLTPITVRAVPDGYEIVSGHRRVHACLSVGLEMIPAIAEDMSHEQAVIALVDSNLQREGLLPSEKAFAYRMKLDAMRHQGKVETCAQIGHKSRDMIAENAGTSRETVRRYIRLTYLERPLLDLVDEGRMALTPAVELSYLTPEEQYDLIETIESEECTPSLSQAVRMRRSSEAGELDIDIIFDIMTEQKANQTEYLKLPMNGVRDYFIPGTSPRMMETLILKALDYYAKALEKKKQRGGDAR